jgi:photosystem I reaction center subunit V
MFSNCQVPCAAAELLEHQQIDLTAVPRHTLPLNVWHLLHRRCCCSLAHTLNDDTSAILHLLPPLLLPFPAGSTYFDSLQQEASFITTTNDPAGFTLVDTMAWGALGHALGFAILAATSSGVIPGVSGP